MQACIRKTAGQMVTLYILIASLMLVAGHARAAGPTSVLPPASAAKGWKQIGAVKTYNPSNLFDYIDGGAEAVEQYAFVGMAHAEYGPAGVAKPAIQVDVYDMTDPLNAYGYFASDRLSGKPVAIGTEGVQIPPTGLNFWKGRYIVQTSIISHPDGATQAAQLALAKAAAARITGPSAIPAAVQALPPGYRPHSQKYQRSNIAGRGFLKNGVVADYPSIGQGGKLFICDNGSPASAKAALAAYQKAMASSPGIAPLKGVGDGGFAVVDRFQKNVVGVTKGKYLIGVVYARDKATAVNLVKQAVGRVK